jgi:hypothetical protein
MDAKLAVAQRRDEFVSAFNRQDVSTLCDLCEPDIIQLPPNQPPVVGADQSFEWWTTGFTAFWIWRQQNGVWRLWRTMWNSSHEVSSLWAGGAALFPDTDFPTLMGPVW